MPTERLAPLAVSQIGYNRFIVERTCQEVGEPQPPIPG
ncbi:hypothetical protein F0726_02949 [Acidithiobacillus caldus]|nr:hypothetical protein F0726_02949 [Acidithiobacillus caldus]